MQANVAFVAEQNRLSRPGFHAEYVPIWKRKTENLALQSKVATAFLLLCSLFNGIIPSQAYKSPGVPNRTVALHWATACRNESKTRLQTLENNACDFQGETRSRTLLTTPLFYVNGELHVGHAYTLVAADVIKRYHKLLGTEVTLLSGTDEHGTKVENVARAAGKTSSQHVEHMRAHYREVQLAYNVPVDVNVHTAEESHKRKVVEAFTKLLSSGDIYEGLHQGYFSPAEDAYYTKCQLQNGRSPQGFAVQPVAEKAFFFRLSKYRDALRQIMGKEGFLLPDKRRNEALALLSSDLPDIAVTRSNTEWGVPVNVPGFEGHTVYVWLDALLGYATNYPQKGLYTNTIMVFGKDILRFIALVWPALLIAFGLPLPQQLICHGWLMHNDAKISKSKGEKVLALPPVGAPDVARFVLMNLGAFGEDIQFDRDRVENLVEVVRDKYANLTHRLTGLLNKRNVEQLGPGGQVPPDLFVEQVVGRWRTLELTMRQYRIDKYGDEVSRVAADINSYITQNRLWEIQDEKELKRHGLVLCQSLLALTIYVYPIMPTLAQLNLERLQPDIDGVPVGIGTASDILQNLGRVAFKPQHMGALM